MDGLRELASKGWIPDDVAETLANLQQWGMIRQMERLPGRKEPRYVQLLCPQDEDPGPSPAPSAAQDARPSLEGDRLDQMEQAIESLQDELQALKQAFGKFKKQFE